MAPTAGGKRTPIDRSLVDRAAGILSGLVGGAIKGASEAWFGPLQPITPIAPPDTAGRQYDYPVGVNLQAIGKPRGEQGENSIDFPTLRVLAEPAQGGFDLVRLAIETRKDQMSAQRWSIKGRDDTDGGKRARDIEQALRRPDLIHTFLGWQRMLLEDLLVLDAPTIYLAPSAGPWRVPEVVDGATIKPLVRPDGRLPSYPDPAYQQALHGLPAVQYTTDELIYAPRNPRPHRLYGMGPVEQVVLTIQIALRRQASQAEFYTAGSLPDLLLSAPDGWATKQIQDFQAHIDSVLSGNTEERRRMRMIPGGIKPFEPKAGALKDEYDEWLARIVCFCFSLSPQALVKQVNRATAETAKESAQEEGLEPLKLWWSEVMDDVLAKAFSAADLCWTWADGEITDPATKAQVTTISLGGKPWQTVDEARAKWGDPATTPEQRAELGIASPEAEGDAAGAEVVQDTALNGAQVASLLSIVQAVTDGKIPSESARGMVVAAFPSLRDDQVNAIVGSLDAFEATKPEPASFPPQFGGPAVAPAGDEDPDPGAEGEKGKKKGKGKAAKDEGDATERVARAMIAEMKRERVFVPARAKQLPLPKV